MIVSCFALIAAMTGSSGALLKGGDFQLQLDEAGYVSSVRIDSGPNLVPSGTRSPILSLRSAGQLLAPTSAHWNPKSSSLTLDFKGHRVQLKVVEKPSHIAFEITKVTPAFGVDVAVWGSYATTLGDEIGETIGVAQGKGYAVGLQVLNPKTLGGLPSDEDDVEHGFQYPDPASNPTSHIESYRGDTAKPTAFGSVLQAYVRNRSKTRVIANWGHAFYTAPGFKDGGLIGSRIALFGCRSADALGTIGKIEQAEGLPHPMMDGVWAKHSPTAHESYLIMPYDVKNLNECLAVTKAAGLKYLYSPDDGFESWGHFVLKKDRFPDNWKSLKECVDRAKTEGVRLGIHTLSNFITPNDPYVTPVPDRRLAQVGASKLAQGLAEKAGEVLIEDPRFFNQMSNNTLKTVRVGDELIQYDSVSTMAPWKLLKCKRGAFGTHARTHRNGAEIVKLMDHGYGTFLTNAALSAEVASNVAKLFSETGLQQLSMDGLEGNWSTGMGQYGPALFAKTWYDHLSPELHGQVINDASMPGAYIWHIQTRDNWGEPWYAGFRQSQTQYRLDNQQYFHRNLMPGMLGWFSLRPETTLEDVQWLLARAAGFDAGFCLVTDLKSISANPQSSEILAAVKAWESARRSHIFSKELLIGLQSVAEEFELSQVGRHHWSLQRIESLKAEVRSSPFETKFNISTSGFGLRTILQIPAEASLADWNVSVDGVPIGGGHSTTERTQRMTFDLAHLSIGEHTLRIEGKLKGAINLEIRSPRGLPRELESSLGV